MIFYILSFIGLLSLGKVNKASPSVAKPLKLRVIQGYSDTPFPTYDAPHPFVGLWRGRQPLSGC